MNYGFIVTRHVNSEKTNKYWNNCIKCIRRFYPFKKIVIIDDNSNYDFVKPEFPFKNIEIIKSEYLGRGELLPFVYLLKRHFFENAVIIHDSVFFHKRIMFEKLLLPVLPLWHFPKDKEHELNIVRIASELKNKNDFMSLFYGNDNYLMAPKWYGVFGVQCFINYNFLKNIETKYNIINLTKVVSNRRDRCCLERIMAILFYREFPNLVKYRSILGDIQTYTRWGYTFDEYKQDLINKKNIKYIVKVWTGR
jgi:hypothetical protein